MHHKCDYLLDNEVFGSGVFQPDVVDPEHSNADSTALWDLLLLSKHYHPDTEIFAKHILNGAPSQGTGALPSRILNRYVDDGGQSFSDVNVEGTYDLLFVLDVKLVCNRSQSLIFQLSGILTFSDFEWLALIW